MAIVDHALHALTDEVVIPRSGWEREPNEDSKPRHIEWESVLTNTAGCLRYGRGLPTAAGVLAWAGAVVTLLLGCSWWLSRAAEEELLSQDSSW